MEHLEHDIWIVGYGRFGRLALDRLGQARQKSRFLVIDPAAQKESSPRGRARFVQEDGVLFLTRRLGAESSAEWIVPAVPLHLAAEWFLAGAGPDYAQRIAVPAEIKDYAPNLMAGGSGDNYTSLATCQCPDDCPEPASYCSVTQEKREQNLFDLLQAIDIAGYQIQVLRSHQLAPGVGGYKARDLLSLQKDLLQNPGRHIVATACRCHGVITALECYA